MTKDFLDDKLHVIWVLFGIAVLAILCLPDPVSLVNSIVSGLLGVAVGRSIK